MIFLAKILFRLVRPLLSLVAIGILLLFLDAQFNLGLQDMLINWVLNQLGLNFGWNFL